VENAVLNKSSKLWEQKEKFVANAPFHYTKIFVEKALGACLWDVDGKKYIDFAGGIGTLNVGHCHPKVVEAIQKQAEKFIHTCFHVAPYESYAQVCEKLVQVTPGNFPKKAVLFNSGAEAVENAVKIARRYTGRQAVIAFDLSFHGRTLLALSLTGKEKPYKTGFGPFVPEVYHAPYAYPYRTPEGIAPENAGQYALSCLENIFKTQVSPERVAAIIVEPVLGEGGFVVPTPDFLPGLRKICDQHGIVLIADEIQTGFGRTGKMFACEHSQVAPDLMTVAKSFAAGMPLSAVCGKAEIIDSVDVGGLGGTYGGNPVSCAAALAVFQIFEEENLVERSQELGGHIRKHFEDFEDRFPFVGEVRGLGSMMAMELVRDRQTKEPLDEKMMKKILELCAQGGLIVLKSGLYNNVLRTLAPLVISDRELEEGIKTIEWAFEEVEKQRGKDA